MLGNLDDIFLRVVFSMREDFVVDDRGVVPYIDMFNGYCRYLPRFRSYIHET